VTNPSEDLACADVVEILTDYLDGALVPAEAQRLERHLDGCPGCSEYLEQIRTLAGSLGGLSGDSIPPEMRARLLADFGDMRRHP
jgi:anti-sigma factor (TIGR02949 family)